MDPNNPGGGGWGNQPPQQGYGGYPAQPQQPAQGWGPAPEGGGQNWGSPMFANAKNGGYVPSEEEKQQAYYAHLFAGLANVVLCGSGLHLVGALIPFFTAKGQKGPFLLFHVNQAFIVQAVLFGANAVLGFVFAIIASLTCGFGAVLYIINAAIWLAATIYPIVLGMKVKNGEWAEYPVAGEKVLNVKSPMFK